MFLCNVQEHFKPHVSSDSASVSICSESDSQFSCKKAHLYNCSLTNATCFLHTCEIWAQAAVLTFARCSVAVYQGKDYTQDHIHTWSAGDLNPQPPSANQHVWIWDYTLWIQKWGPYLFELKLLPLSHYLWFQAYTSAVAITATMAFSETRRIDSFTSVLLHFR